jgi:hypothetical protein
MGDIREMTTTGVDHPEVRELMEKFWESYDKLWGDMDNLTLEEFNERQHEMWSWRNKASEIRGDYFLLTLSGMSNKAEKLFGEDYSRKYIEFLNNKRDA